MASTPAAQLAEEAEPTRGRRLIALAIVIPLLALSNVMSNRVLPEWAYVPWNLSMGVALLLIARRAGEGQRAVGLHIRQWRRPMGVGMLLVSGVALIFGLGIAIPATRVAFLDSRASSPSLAVMLYQTLARIPLGTVFLEEVAFRGVLPALLGSSPALRWRWWPVLGASFLFGLWHILPSLGIARGNAAVASALGGDQLVATVLAVVAMMAAGILLCALVRLGKGIKTTMLVHWSTNSLGFLAAWLVIKH
ncbi:CAAX protease self-immunity [Nakamurella panacisegetis]|uniref:CAAX protease self-immunity n=1 Tax=Nakamurella panacisegetis TaxID=1090615 RepID=A0A1H0JPR1_9ACTN|nr:CPBP family intramembrane glutamic endopeptidase [Nakamurella panacisegetis]SDO45785.1 CAAX protease self-immunity [Nakamurella panacisegetis]